MRRALLAVVLLATGCDRLFGLQSVDTERDARSNTEGDGDVLADAPELDAPVDAVGDAPPPSLCPAGYTIVDGLAVKFVNVAMTWPSAMMACIDDRGTATNYTHLVVFTNDVQRGMVGATTSAAFWIGYTDRVVEGAYQWVTTQPNIYPGAGDAPWASNEPSADSPSDDCAVQRGVDDWDSIECLSSAVTFMCQCDAFPPDTTKY